LGLGRGTHTQKRELVEGCIKVMSFAQHMVGLRRQASVFGPLQRVWFDKTLDEIGKGMEIRNAIKEYITAHTKSFKTETILMAWRKVGIHPLNPDVFSQTDFAPSISTFTHTQVPGFPFKMPHIPDTPSDDIFDPTALHDIDEESGSASGTNWTVATLRVMILDLILIHHLAVILTMTTPIQEMIMETHIRI
jgi:hypothetical protein